MQTKGLYITSKRTILCLNICILFVYISYLLLKRDFPANPEGNEAISMQHWKIWMVQMMHHVTGCVSISAVTFPSVCELLLLHRNKQIPEEFTEEMTFFHIYRTASCRHSLLLIWCRPPTIWQQFLMAEHWFLTYEVSADTCCLKAWSDVKIV